MSSPFPLTAYRLPLTAPPPKKTLKPEPLKKAVATANHAKHAKERDDQEIPFFRVFRVFRG
jgi:hypothetical protein